MSKKTAIQQTFGPLPLQGIRSDDRIGLENAQAQIGNALRRAINRTGSGLKDFGDPSHVKRVCDGDVQTVIARIWQREDTRREFLVALAEESGMASVETRINLHDRVGRPKMAKRLLPCDDIEEAI